MSHLIPSSFIHIANCYNAIYNICFIYREKYGNRLAPNVVFHCLIEMYQVPLSINLRISPPFFPFKVQFLSSLYYNFTKKSPMLAYNFCKKKALSKLLLTLANKSKLNQATSQ